MLGVCFIPPTRDHDVNHWAFVLSHYQPDTMYFLQDEKCLCQAYSWSAAGVEIELAEELPNDVPLVLFQPPDAKHIQGTIALADFTHPPDAIYMFGRDHGVVDEDCMGSRVADYVVYVETDNHHEMYSHVAAAIALHDRRVSLG